MENDGGEAGVGREGGISIIGLTGMDATGHKYITVSPKAGLICRTHQYYRQ